MKIHTHASCKLWLFIYIQIIHIYSYALVIHTQTHIPHTLYLCYLAHPKHLTVPLQDEGADVRD